MLESSLINHRLRVVSCSHCFRRSPASANGGHSNGLSNGTGPVKPTKTTTDKAANFSKGTLIELSSGELKRVEDMRTEDFISSSCKNPNLQVIDTTVVKMVLQSTQVVLITLAYNNRKVCGNARVRLFLVNVTYTHLHTHIAPDCYKKHSPENVC